MEVNNLEIIKRHLLYKRIIDWEENKLVLDDGTIVTLEETESDCCASAIGEFKNVKLDAVITDIDISEPIEIPNDDTTINEVKIVIYHNQNPIALGEMIADAGNGGYYYSVGSFVVNGIHFPIVEA